MAATPYLLYDASGRITRTGRVDKLSLVAIQNPGTPMVGEADPETEWVDGGVITPRADLDSICSLTNAGGWTADGSDLLTYGSSLPDPTHVSIECDNPRFTPIDTVVVTDGELELTATAAGEYTITLTTPDHPQYLTKVITATAT